MNSSEMHKKTRGYRSAIYFSLTDSLKDEWRNLWENSDSANIFNSPSWFVAACRAFSYKNILIIIVRESPGDKLIAVLPLVKTRPYGFSVFVLPGTEFIDCFSFLTDITDDAVIREVSTELSRLGVVYLTGLIEKDIHVFLRQDKNISFFSAEENPYINCGEGQLKKFLDIGESKSIRKAERLFGQISFVHVTKDHKEILQKAFEIDRFSSKHKKGKGVFWRDDTKKFFIQLIRESPSSVFVDLLFFAGEPIAYSIGFICNGIYVCSQKAHLSLYERYRPGGIAFRKFLEAAAHEDIREINLGKGYDQFKMDFTKDSRVLYSVIISKNILTRFLLKSILQLRARAYTIVIAYPKLYLQFKRLKKYPL